MKNKKTGFGKVLLFLFILFKLLFESQVFAVNNNLKNENVILFDSDSNVYIIATQFSQVVSEQEAEDFKSKNKLNKVENITTNQKVFKIERYTGTNIALVYVYKKNTINGIWQAEARKKDPSLLTDLSREGLIRTNLNENSGTVDFRRIKPYTFKANNGNILFSSDFFYFMDFYSGTLDVSRDDEISKYSNKGENGFVILFHDPHGNRNGRCQALCGLRTLIQNNSDSFKFSFLNEGYYFNARDSRRIDYTKYFEIIENERKKSPENVKSLVHELMNRYLIDVPLAYQLESGRQIDTYAIDDNKLLSQQSDIERDEVLSAEIINKVKGNQEKNKIFISFIGFFHREKIIDELKKNKIGYLLIEPFALKQYRIDEFIFRGDHIPGFYYSYDDSEENDFEKLINPLLLEEYVKGQTNDLASILAFKEFSGKKTLGSGNKGPVNLPDDQITRYLEPSSRKFFEKRNKIKSNTEKLFKDKNFDVSKILESISNNPELSRSKIDFDLSNSLPSQFQDSVASFLPNENKFIIRDLNSQNWDVSRLNVLEKIQIRSRSIFKFSSFSQLNTGNFVAGQTSYYFDTSTKKLFCWYLDLERNEVFVFDCGQIKDALRLILPNRVNSLNVLRGPISEILKVKNINSNNLSEFDKFILLYNPSFAETGL